MGKLERGLVSVPRQRLSSEEFSALEELTHRPSGPTIPDQHRERLLKAGYVRELVDPYNGMFALAVTGRGLRRLAMGK